ncbi:uncharacterized protein [Diadema antillarum]|uniref:uncharacterized protein n=1 Tax=Diadema antillarum TaxID=105358 RepID=UPI003A86EC18
MAYEGSSSLVWQALGCLAGIDWTALFFWCLITFSLCLVSILLISIFIPVTVKEDEGMPSTSSTQPPQGLNVFQQLFTQKLLPIDSSTGWQLAGVSHELRSWERKVELGDGSFSLHGSCTIVPSHPQVILETLKDTEKFLEWDNEVIGCSYVSLPSTTEASDYPLMADVVSLALSPRYSPPDGMVDRILAFLTTPFKLLSRGAVDMSSSNVHKPAVVARSWRMEEDMSIWMFCRTVFKGKGRILQELWSYSFAQPSEEDPNKSIMHHITCTSTSQSDSHQREKPTLRLAALKQYFELRDLKVRPLRHTSLRHLNTHIHPSSMKGHSKGSCSPNKSVFCLPSEGFSDHRDIDANFLPIYSGESTELIAGRDKSPHRSTPSRANGSRKPRATSLNFDSSWQQDHSSSDDAGFYSERKEVPLRYRKQRVKKALSADAAATGERKGMVTPVGREKDGSQSPDRNTTKQGSGDFELNGVIENLDDYKTLANESAEYVLQESLKAATINVNAPEDDQIVQTGGWSFHCLEKDVVILKKPKQGKYYSFLGKGIIKASPDTVFKAVRNPRTRFTYDTMLKKMNNPRNLSEDICIYHMVHEVPQVLKKEARDFCVLQICKSDGDHHVVSFRSVEWSACPESGSMTRGHILPSGWVIEPVGEEPGQYSMVTYIVQVALCGKDIPTIFGQFLTTRVPLSIAYLRLFLEAQLP